MTKQISKIESTGITGMDEILDGGFPSHRIYLVEGKPGSGKTTLAMQFLIEGVRQGERCLYVTLSESVAELRAVAGSHGWNLEGLDIFELPLQANLNKDSLNTFFHTSEIELGQTNETLLNEIRRVKPSRVVIDSVTELKLLSQSPMRFRRQILGLKDFFMQQGATVLLLDDKTTTVNEQEVQSIVHGILRLEQLSPEYGPERRRMMLAKLRGVSFRGGFHDFVIRKGGVVVFPRLMASSHGVYIEERDISGLLGSGVDGIDSLMGGGIERGTSTLVMGPAGCGKSTLVQQYAIHAAEQGEHVSLFTFDESIRTVKMRSKGMGRDLQKFVDKGTMKMTHIDPAQLSPGEFCSLIRESVEAHGSKVVLIDSLNGYLNAMPEERFLIIQMHELLSYLNQMGVVTFLVVVQHGLLGTAMETSVDVSYLADNCILLRYFEDRGHVKQALSVLKKRVGRHERTIRELWFDEKGVHVGKPLGNFQGVLSGTPSLVSPELNKME